MVKVIIRKQAAQGKYYTEELGDGVTLDMMQIPSGTFWMGTSDEEIERLCVEYSLNYFKQESPQHQVEISPFFMGKYPITQAQWKVIADLEPVDRTLDSDPSHFKEEPPQPPFSKREEPKTRWDRPVEQVSWEDAVEFCQRLSRETRREYRLPTEAEWEYACRAIISQELTQVQWNQKYHQPFHCGETITTDLANYRGTDREINKKVYPGNYGRGPKGLYREETTPVGYFKVANAFGLYDMHGNVWEWCEDDYHNNYQDAPADGRAWLNNDQNTTKILRGGSWYYDPGDCRSATRLGGSRARYSALYIGFRVVRSAPRT